MGHVKHRGTQRLETERLILRRFVSEDAGAMYKNWASDDEVTKYLTWPTHPNIDVSKFVTEDWVKSYSDEKYYQWAIVKKENGVKVRAVNYRLPIPDNSTKNMPETEIAPFQACFHIQDLSDNFQLYLFLK